MGLTPMIATNLPTNYEEWLVYVELYPRPDCPICGAPDMHDHWCDWDCCQCTKPYGFSCKVCGYDNIGET